MANQFENHSDTASGPAWRLQAVTPHDTNELAYLPKAIYVGGAGDLSLIGGGDTAPVVLAAVPAGSIIPVRAKIVRNTGTTATDIVALY